MWEWLVVPFSPSTSPCVVFFFFFNGWITIREDAENLYPYLEYYDPLSPYDQCWLEQKLRQ